MNVWWMHCSLIDYFQHVTLFTLVPVAVLDGHMIHCDYTSPNLPQRVSYCYSSCSQAHLLWDCVCGLRSVLFFIWFSHHRPGSVHFSHAKPSRDDRLAQLLFHHSHRIGWRMCHHTQAITEMGIWNNPNSHTPTKQSPANVNSSYVWWTYVYIYSWFHRILQYSKTFTASCTPTECFKLFWLIRTLLRLTLGRAELTSSEVTSAINRNEWLHAICLCSEMSNHSYLSADSQKAGGSGDAEVSSKGALRSSGQRSVLWINVYKSGALFCLDLVHVNVLHAWHGVIHILANCFLLFCWSTGGNIASFLQGRKCIQHILFRPHRCTQCCLVSHAECKQKLCLLTRSAHNTRTPQGTFHFIFLQLLSVRTWQEQYTTFSIQPQHTMQSTCLFVSVVYDAVGTHYFVYMLHSAIDSGQNKQHMLLWGLNLNGVKITPNLLKPSGPAAHSCPNRCMESNRGLWEMSIKCGLCKLTQSS